MEDELSLMEGKGKEVTKEQKEHLCNRIEELKRGNAALLAENDMFERFICRMDPQDLLSQSGGDSLEAAGAPQLEGGGRGRRQRSRSSIADRPHQLTLEQKLYVAQREVRETLQDQEKLKQKYENIQDNYKASLKEAELRLADIRKAKKEFERRLLKPMKDNRLEMKEPERVLQYIGDKSMVAQSEKYNLKNHALKVHEKKLQQQLQQRRTEKDTGAAEFKDVFQDFSAQRIHQNLDELQVNNLKVQLVLSSHKDKLQNVTRESAELSSDISNRKQMLAKIEEEIQRAEEERLKAEALKQHLRRQMTDYQAPDIAEYMHVKDRHKKLQQSIHTWERKVGIAQMALRSQAKARSTQRATLTPANSAEAGARSKERQISVKLPYIAEHRA
ncbi:cilia- and flagella-associated protein 263 [Sparus aurata]|uniref:Cilia- and flagella-associated protein 263 n=1 Tax=Sparus aurata TaxID=8175 RepID=A0A671YR95_SPAAU|nr:coiled-coil domain-containing protein 113 [Sparus aurata]XP_030281699.1 coiled-coil domain-containing protein 113 [Sparus aurata]XP_030281700.1 coiled-coil domain-containing protein 113 [Sparus aurata]